MSLFGRKKNENTFPVDIKCLERRVEALEKEADIDCVFAEIRYRSFKYYRYHIYRYLMESHLLTESWCNEEVFITSISDLFEEHEHLWGVRIKHLGSSVAIVPHYKHAIYRAFDLIRKDKTKKFSSENCTITSPGYGKGSPWLLCEGALIYSKITSKEIYDSEWNENLQTRVGKKLKIKKAIIIPGKSARYKVKE